MSDSPAAILYDSGGTEKGTVTNPVKVDPTGATTQPVTTAANNDVAPANGSITAVDVNAIIGYGALGTFTPVANSTADIACSGYATVKATIFGTWTGNLVFEATADGTRWFTINGVTPGIPGRTYALSTPSVIFFNSAAYTSLRIRAPTGVGAGPSVTVSWRLSVSPSVPMQGDIVTVRGPIAAGAPTNYPIPVGGVDSVGKLRIPLVSPGGIQASMTAAQAICAGLSPGVSGQAIGTIVQAALTELPVRATSYVEQTSNAQRSINSTSAADTAAGTGARTIQITYYSNNGSGVVTGPFTETLTLNGTAAVNTVSTTICFIEKIEILTVGSTGVAVGAIQLFAATSGAGGVIASIASGTRRTYYAHHYVPSGSLCFIMSAYASSTAGSANVPAFRGRYKLFNALNVCERPAWDDFVVQGATGSKQLLFQVPITIPGPSVVVAYCTPENTGSQTNRIQFDYLEI